MKVFAGVLFGVSVGLATVAVRMVPTFWGFAIGALAFTLGTFAILGPDRRPHHVARLGGLRWSRGEFCRGWLITGDTGSGKTTSGINQLAHQVFQNEPTWGGLCVDEKGVYWETLAAMAAHYGRSNDLIHVRVRPTDAGLNWIPPHRFNLTGDPSIPAQTYAKFVVDTATSLGQGGEKGFFKSQAQVHIAQALRLLSELDLPPTLVGVYEVLSSTTELKARLTQLVELVPLPPRVALINHFENRLLRQPEEQRGGVLETIGNYLQYFLTPEVAEVFSSHEATFDMSEVDRGRILCLTMPQRFQTERRYVNTFLKLLFYHHALRRFDKSAADRRQENLIILWADEAQRFMTASEDGTSDYNVVDVIREAGATIIAASQSTTSLVPPLGNDKARVLGLNLRNRLIFRCADEADALQAADFLGRRKVIKRSWGMNSGRRTVTFSESEEHKIKPHELRTLRDHECVVTHCEKGFRRRILPPLNAEGQIPSWFSRLRHPFT